MLKLASEKNVKTWKEVIPCASCLFTRSQLAPNALLRPAG